MFSLVVIIRLDHTLRFPGHQFEFWWGFLEKFQGKKSHTCTINLLRSRSVKKYIRCVSAGKTTNIFFYRTGTQQIYCVRMRFFSLKFLKKTSSELELVTWEPECMIEPAKTSNCWRDIELLLYICQHMVISLTLPIC